MKKTHTVNVDNIPDEYQFFVKPEMTNDEIGQLGMIVLKQKISNIKNKIRMWFHAKRTER